MTTDSAPGPPHGPTPGELLDRLDPQELPRLALFLNAYLDPEHAPGAGSAAGAAYAYVAEAELDELEELAADWRLFAAAAHRIPLERVNRILRERFRSGWQVASLDEIDAVSRELEAALRE